MLNWPRTHFPAACKGVEIVIGIDEAGRGPVLGSLVYAGAFWPLSENDEIKRLGFDDSKQLKEGERDKLFDVIRSHPSVGWVIEELTAVYISEEMLRINPVSLNALSYDAVIRILSTIQKGHNNSDISISDPPVITDIFIDTVGDPEFYKSRLTAALGKDFGRFIIEKKADATYKVVSAASIIAKVTRDSLLKNWVWAEPTASTLSKDFGSGYPSDETCVKWLEKAQHPVFGYPNLVRFSWSTCREALNKGSACKVKECDDEENNGGANIKDYFGSSAGVAKKVKRSAYFTSKKLKLVTLDDIKKMS
eukprot:gene23109-31426_t